MSAPCFVEFAIPDEDRFARLVMIVDELKRDKDAGILAPGLKWKSLFDERALAHFWWPTPAEREEWLRRWNATPVPERWSDPALRTPWDFDSLIDAFANAEYELLGIRRQGEHARLEFEPAAFPYGGVNCMTALVEALEGRITMIDEGT